MILAPIRDGCFTQHAYGMGFGGDNAKEKPKRVTWKKQDQDQPARFYTDICLGEARNGKHLKVAWLIEPPDNFRQHYLNLRGLRQQFDWVLTWHDGELMHRNSLFYPFGGSWIAPADWGLHQADKKEMVSIIGSGKKVSDGHILRHNVIDRYKDRVNVYGYYYNPIPRKITALAPYRYSIVIEPYRGNSFFTEKLIDCIACGTVPIYWGTTNIKYFFDERGIIQFKSMDDLAGILASLTESDYEERLPYLQNNIVRAREFRCPDDWIAEHYPNLFEGLAYL